MEELPIKLNELSPIMNLFIEKIQLLDSSVFTKQQKVQFTKEMVEVVDNLRMFFENVSASDHNENIKNFNEKIERAFSQFEWNTNVAVKPYEFSKFSENGKILISSILKLLGIKGCGILIIETYLMFCSKILAEMRQQVQDKEISDNKSRFKLLLDGFSVTANALKKYWHIAFSMNQKSTIMLYLHQICKILPFLLKMIELQNVDVKKYALNVLTICLDKMLSEIHSEGNVKLSSYGQKFISQMDYCLYKLNELSNYSKDFLSFIEKANATSNALKPAIDELLCMVMAIAHITNFQEDYSAILTASHKVLHEFSDLTNEIKEENISAIKLNASSLGESLCNLECQVNNAVLKLVLEVFSGVNSPLKNILNKCRENIAKDNKSSEDLNVLISDFDLDMDKIMQIGFFAISCTTSLNRILQIQSCLASLESLETELIPSLTALYIDCNEKKKINFQYLFDFWLNEITEMKNLIDSVLDPAGFCRVNIPDYDSLLLVITKLKMLKYPLSLQVVRIQIKSLSPAFQEDSHFSNFCLNKLKYGLKQAVRYSRKLIRTLKTSMKDEDETNEKTEDYLKKFQLVVHECEAVLDLLNEEQDSNKTIVQAVKRYNLLTQTLDKLSSHLFLLETGEESKYEDIGNSTDRMVSKLDIPQKNYYKLCESPEHSVTPFNVIPEILTPYLNTGLSRSKRRNILYTTSEVHETEENSNRPIPQARYWDKVSLSSKRSRCCKPLNLNLELENTIDLEITTILKNISNLTDSFHKSSKSRLGIFKKEEIKKEAQKKKSRDVACGAEKDIDDTKPFYSTSGCCAKLDMQDEEPNKSEEESEVENFFGKKLRNNFLQTLDDLSFNDTLLVVTDTESTSHIDSPERVNDIKIIEEKISFLKNRMPSLLP